MLLLIPQVARLQEMTSSLEQLNKKSSRDYELLKQDTERLKSKYEKENQSAAAMTKSVQAQLAAEQSKNTRTIAKLQDDLLAREADMSKLQITAAERTRMIQNMKVKLEEYRNESDRAIQDNKKKIASMRAGFERELTQTKAAHKVELAQLETKLQGEIHHLQRDLDFCADAINGLETMLAESSASNQNLSGDIVGLNTQRHSTEALLKQSSHDLDVTKQEVGRLQKQINMAQQSGATNTAQIQDLQKKLREKSAELIELQNGATQFSSDKKKLLEDLGTLQRWKENTQNSINVLFSEVTPNVLSGDGGRIDSVIAKLSGIRDELHKKDTELSHARSAAEELLRKEGVQKERGQEMQQQFGKGSPPPAVSGAVIGTFSSSNAHVIGSGFSTRQKNIASVRNDSITSKMEEKTPGTGRGATVTFPVNPGAAAPAAAAPAKSQAPNTMSAYDAALAAMQK